MVKIKKEKIPVKKAGVIKKKAARKAVKISAAKKSALKIKGKPVKAKRPVGKVIPKKKKMPPAPLIIETPVSAVAAGPLIEAAPAAAEPKVIAPARPPAKEKPLKKEEEEKPAASVIERLPAVPSSAQPELKVLELDLPVNVKDLAVKLQEKSSILIKHLMSMGLMVGINQSLEEATAVKLCQKYGYQIKEAPGQEEIALHLHQEQDPPESLHPRAPVVTLMGHVDHGKTSLLDAIRKSKVAELEHGGITQHIGAYRVVLPGGEITFLDTPGHEAFTAMRARGASITDIVVLVVAADDGIMPQTREAIDHARAAGVPIVVALNKADKPQADVEKVKKQLSEFDLVPEDWGGKTITVAVSAKTGKGIDELLEMILLEAHMLELKANPDRLAKGVVVEAKMSKGKGPVATLLVQNGTLRLNENIIAGKYYAKIRAMFDDRGHAVTGVPASFPVEVLGFSGIPQAGEFFFALEDEKEVRQLSQLRQEKERQLEIRDVKRINLEDLYAQIKAGKIKELKLIIKADVQGSLEAIKETLSKLDASEIKLNIIHEGIGSINSSDAILAVASNALILGFNIDADERAKEIISKEGVEVRTYNIIYELVNDIKQALEGMLEPKLKKVFMGRVEIRKVFKVSKTGIVAGCFVIKGKIVRTALVDLARNGEVICEGKLASLKRFKEDVREVQEGFECGLSIGGFEDYKEGDIIEAYEIEKIARKL